MKIQWFSKALLWDLYSFAGVNAGKYLLTFLSVFTLWIEQAQANPACTISEVISFTLVNSATDQDIGPLDNGSVINLFYTPHINIRANICGEPAGSVKFVLNGSVFRIENEAPYALAEDYPTGNYKDWNVAPGNYTLLARPYSGSNGTGTTGIAKTISFQVINCPAEVTSFTLVNSATDLDIGPPNDGAVINLFCNPQINIRANVACSNPAGSVKFVLNGNVFRIENEAPYAMAEDNPTGNYKDWNVTPGTYKLVARPFSGQNGSGITGIPKTITFQVINCAPEVTSLTLVNSSTDQDIEPLADGSVINLFYTPDINLRANVACATGIGSVKFILNNHVMSIENAAPYAIAGDNPTGNYKDWNITPGTYTLIARPYTGPNGTGCAGISKTVTFYVIDCAPEITSFMLVNSLKDLDIEELYDGSVINLYYTPNVNIRADVLCGDTAISVKFILNGNVFSIENDEPYALAGDFPTGDYHDWNVTPGTYTLMAKPFELANGLGDPGTSKTITFQVINQADCTGDSDCDDLNLCTADYCFGGRCVHNTISPCRADKWSGNELTSIESADQDMQESLLTAFPNPFSESVNLSFSLSQHSKARLDVISIDGKKIATLFDGFTEANQLNQIRFEASSLTNGIYFCRLIAENGEVHIQKLTLFR